MAVLSPNPSSSVFNPNQSWIVPNPIPLSSVLNPNQQSSVLNFKQNRGPKSSENVMQEMAEAFFIELDKIIQREKLPTT